MISKQFSLPARSQNFNQLFPSSQLMKKSGVIWLIVLELRSGIYLGSVKIFLNASVYTWYLDILFSVLHSHHSSLFVLVL